MKSAHVSGFTLLELMITVLVIAVLAVIAVPSYLEQVRKGKRSEATRAIGEMQLRQERYRAEHPTYGTLDQVTGSAAASTGLNNSYKYYSVGVDVNAATAGTRYVLTATRKGDLATDPKCGDFSMTVDAGVVTKAVSSGDLDYCWRQ